MVQVHASSCACAVRSDLLCRQLVVPVRLVSSRCMRHPLRALPALSPTSLVTFAIAPALQTAFIASRLTLLA
jgi:hypothetical protein